MHAKKVWDILKLPHKGVENTKGIKCSIQKQYSNIFFVL